jgi:very-short-patch-repair endonuclease
MGAVLDAGPAAALSHHSAGGWWGLPGFPFDQLQVSRPRDVSDRPGRLSIVHEVRHLPEHHVRVLEGIRVVVPARIPFELANIGVHPWKVERTLDNAWSRGLANHFTYMAMLDDLAERGRTGITLLRELMLSRGPDYIPPASGLEARFNDVITKAGFPEMRRQVNVGDETTWIGRVDFLASDCPLVVEIQSERFHTALLDSAADKCRVAALRAAGFVVVELTDVDVWHRTHVVIDRIRAGRAEALGRSGPEFRRAGVGMSGQNEG